MTDPLDIIPADRRETARSALTAVFGAAPVVTLDVVPSGASGAQLYRAEVAGRAHLLRIDTRRDMFRDPQRTYACMQAAADVGIAPPVRHADPATGVVIMNFVVQRPLDDYPGGRDAMLRELVGLIARLQATPVFPPLIDYLALIAGMLRMLRESGLFAAGLLDRHAEGFERIRQAYPRDSSPLVSSHNDLNPSNILFDGKRLWLVDWEAAFRNDPLVDVAVVANYNFVMPAHEGTLLEAWLGRAPDDALRARFVLMRQLARLYYACLTFSVIATIVPRDPPETELAGPSLFEVSTMIGQGRLVAASPEGLRLCGKAFLGEFLLGTTAPRVEEALVTVQ